MIYILSRRFALMQYIRIYIYTNILKANKFWYSTWVTFTGHMDLFLYTLFTPTGMPTLFYK
jgi:hypothetical protein